MMKSTLITALSGLLTTNVVYRKQSLATYFQKPENRPLLLANRGSMGEFPENSPMAFEDAYGSGADFIAVQLYISKDGEIVIFQDKTLDQLTNVADLPQFTDKKSSDGKWYTNNLTLAELKQLGLRQRYSFRPQQFND